jgi:YHS domain-containing protein
MRHAKALQNREELPHSRLQRSLADLWGSPAPPSMALEHLKVPNFSLPFYWNRVVVLYETRRCRDRRDKWNRGAVMEDEVWGDVKHWGLQDRSDESPVISIDPVCSRQVNEAKAAGKTSYAGVVYYFCSKECQRDFEQAPGDYTGQPHGSPSHIVDINAASAEDLRSVFRVDEDRLNQILKNRPYQSWAEFKSKNPGFSDPMLRSLRKWGVIISTPDLHRIVW